MPCLKIILDRWIEHSGGGQRTRLELNFDDRLFFNVEVIGGIEVK